MFFNWIIKNKYMTSVYICSPFLDVYINNGFPELWNENVSTGYIWIFPNIQKKHICLKDI